MKHPVTKGILVLVTIPTAIYALVNFYWWLFDGNVLRGDKMFASLMILTISVIGAGLSNYIEDGKW